MWRQFINRKNLLFLGLFLAAFLGRTIFHLGPNIELVTTALIIASYYLGRKQALILTYFIMVVTDLIIGNTNIFIFTWSGFLIPALLAAPIFKKIKLGKKRTVLFGTGMGIASNLFFYLWTNFGVWLLDSWGMYPKTAAGLMMSYFNGLPFLRNQLAGTLIFLPVTFILIETIYYFAENRKNLFQPSTF